ncbi:MAG: pilin [Candidatus Gracilibacteria bacterium]
MKKRVNILGYLLIVLISNGLFCHEVFATISKEELTQVVQKIIPDASSGSHAISYTSIAQEIQYWIFALVGVIAIIYIIWAGAKLLWAPGNMEEVSTAMKSLGYIIIGLALIPFAYFIVSFLSSLNIN